METLLSMAWDPAGHLTVQAAAVVTILATQWLKHYLENWRFTQLVALGIAVGSQCIAVALARSQMWFQAFWIGVLGASLATFGYEMILNLAGAAGFGQRADS